MNRLSLSLAAAAAIVTIAFPAEARDESRALPPAGIVTASALSDEMPEPVLARGSAQPVLGPSPVPIGWLQFCGERPLDCRSSGPAEAVVRLTAARAAELRQVNLSVNRALRPVPDMEHYGVPQRWTIPSDGMGSCHHYMLTKRQALMALGWPQSALLVTVVRDRRGQGHAILTVRTDKGDVVLDNLTDRILAWSATGHQYLMRQSGSSPNRFVALSPASTLAVAGGSSRRRALPPRSRTTWPAAWRAAPVANGPWAGQVWHPWRS
jgi:predicted transglutaminase-like cysteine proteinase